MSDEVIEPDDSLGKLMRNAFEKLEFELENGKRYYVQWSEKEVVEGVKIQTRGNDESFPTFLLDDKMPISVARARVLGPVPENVVISMENVNPDSYSLNLSFEKKEIE